MRSVWGTVGIVLAVLLLVTVVALQGDAIERGELFSIAFSGIVALSTVVYAVLTWRLVTETRMLRKVQTEPRVTIGVEEDHTGRHGYELTIRNEGQGVAKNVRFEFDGDSSFFRSAWLGNAPPEIPELPLIKNGLENLEPRHVHRFFLGTVTSREFERAAKNPWGFCVTCEDIYGNRYSNNYTLDFSLFQGMLVESNQLKEMSGHLEKISGYLKSIQANLSKQSKS